MDLLIRNLELEIEFVNLKFINEISLFRFKIK